MHYRSSDGRTSLIWCAFRNNDELAKYLMDNGAQIDLEDNEGWNALDIAVIKMNYNVALTLKRRGLVLKEKEIYEPHLWQEYDIELFFSYLDEEREIVDHEVFFELIKSK